jgi:hypothetical protein
MATFFPETTPILPASAILSEYSLFAPGVTDVNLLPSGSFRTLDGWEFGPLLSTRLGFEDGATILTADLVSPTQEVQPLSREVILKPGAAYVLNVELRAFAPFDLVRFPNHAIPDSYPDSWNQDLNWTKYSVVFVTPQWQNGEQEVLIEIARVYDRGSIQFRELSLTEISPDG